MRCLPRDIVLACVQVRAETFNKFQRVRLVGLGVHVHSIAGCSQIPIAGLSPVRCYVRYAGAAYPAGRVRSLRHRRTMMVWSPARHINRIEPTTSISL